MIKDIINGAMPGLLMEGRCNEVIKLLTYLEDNKLADRNDSDLLFFLLNERGGESG